VVDEEKRKEIAQQMKKRAKKEILKTLPGSPDGMSETLNKLKCTSKVKF
jgi:hypothetical protein